jgi:hydroxymethylglutaryl-CoA reductase
VVAAASHAAKLLREGDGIVTEAQPSHMIGQIQLLEVVDGRRLENRVREAKRALVDLANEAHPSLVSAGGGARDLTVRAIPSTSSDDPIGDMWVVELLVDVQDAMGANAVNSMCEALAPRIEELSGGRVNLRILSNLSDLRTVRARGRVPIARFLPSDPTEAAALAHRIVEASVFAERDPHRAATHNKGIMNGVDAVLLAFGQDTRAVEAGAHAYAARNGRYTALSRFRIEEGCLVGDIELPMAVGTVGGVASTHPTVAVARQIAGISRASELASIATAVGLAQNLAALRALAGEGIQSGHMRLHARKSSHPPALGNGPRELAAEANRRAS